MDYHRPIVVGRMGIFLFVEIIGRGSLRRVTTTSRFGGRGALLRQLVCVFALHNFIFICAL